MVLWRDSLPAHTPYGLAGPWTDFGGSHNVASRVWGDGWDFLRDWRLSRGAHCRIMRWKNIERGGGGGSLGRAVSCDGSVPCACVCVRMWRGGLALAEFDQK